MRPIGAAPGASTMTSGRIRSVLVHRPGKEMEVIDPTKRIESIGSFGDLKAGWYFQSDTMPQVAEMQAQHDALVAALKAKGVEVHHVDGDAAGRSSPATRAIR